MESVSKIRRLVWQSALPKCLLLHCNYLILGFKLQAWGINEAMPGSTMLV